MSTSITTMIRMRGVKNKIRHLVETLDDTAFRTQFHSQLSPIGWHLGHCLFIENYWLHEVIQNNNKYTKKLKKLYTPELCPIHKRGSKLPKIERLLTDTRQQQDNNDLLLIEMTPPLSQHPLFKDEFIQNYIIQHYARHYEHMQMILHQIGHKKENPDFMPETLLQSRPVSIQAEQMPGGNYEIGGQQPFAYDNEQPEHIIKLDTFSIAMHPVSNAEYLAFMQDGAYDNNNHWSTDAWQWLKEKNIYHPEHWRLNKHNDWYGLNEQGPFTLEYDAPVYGLSYYEASAFAHWANARLPHEFEWESYAKLERIQNSGKVWEWCANTLQPYQNFKSFPGDKTESCFDNKHYVLKGASQYTRPEIRRASFRNYATAEQRHQFAGLRLVFE
ncbi:MAG: SUMF1/EgtB/PvdO family nonheme iron enzyme [Gammaproteobacteria bacterium]|nr:SUMF1/EgtB/PvdO family nonheme iron enzyme [Gammaproteobacteria bacterium]MDH5734514.1 SUMF1/EgtB/PvdO family nonheme iron enzyme [Gammaproteobacteria bacterium]